MTSADEENTQPINREVVSLENFVKSL
ncbi:hypothetical protein [Latilactobacillus phage TMW 1.1365 P2]|nr:hypothetical protein [Latilactobacillus phage TMW 1.1365 P2]